MTDLVALVVVGLVGVARYGLAPTFVAIAAALVATGLVLHAWTRPTLALLAVALCGAAAVCLWFGPGLAFFYAGYVLVILAALLLTPAAALWLARGLRPIFKRLRPVEGALAADSLIQAPRRTSATSVLLILMLSSGIPLLPSAATSRTTRV